MKKKKMKKKFEKTIEKKRQNRKAKNFNTLHH